MINRTIAHNVIVLGSHTTALYILRSLGRLGAKVIVVDTHRHGEARFSRYCSKFLTIEQFDSEALIEVMDRLRRTFGPCAIFPCNDEAASALSQSIDSIDGEHVPIVAPWTVTCSAYDKRFTYELAQTAGVPMPKHYVIDADGDIGEISRQCEYPVLIKPTTTAEFRTAFGVKAIRADNATELKTRYQQVLDKVDASGLLIQEFVPGTNRHFWHYGAVFNKTDALVEYVISRRRQYPIDFGTASHAEIAQAPEVKELGARILAAMEFLGPAEVQFKYDQRDGSYKLLDVNPRFWKSCAIAQLLNVNMPLLAYDLFAGTDVRRATVRDTQKLVWFDLLPDIFVSSADLLAGRTTVRDLRQSYAGERIEATFCRDDWVPGIVLIALAPYLFFKGAG